MAERKAALRRAPDRPELEALLARARKAEITEEDLLEQRVSFIYGNAPKGSRITRESAKRSVTQTRIMPPKGD